MVVKGTCQTLTTPTLPITSITYTPYTPTSSASTDTLLSIPHLYSYGQNRLKTHGSPSRFRMNKKGPPERSIPPNIWPYNRLTQEEGEARAIAGQRARDELKAQQEADKRRAKELQAESERNRQAYTAQHGQPSVAQPVAGTSKLRQNIIDSSHASSSSPTPSSSRRETV